MGYCWTVVLNWEEEETQPKVESIPAIVAFLGCDPFPPPASMPEQLAALRRKNGWTIKQAARQLGIDASTWGRWDSAGIPGKRHRGIVAAFIQA